VPACSGTYREMYQIQIFQTRPEPDVVEYPPAYQAGTGMAYCDGCCIALYADDVYEVV